jgi:hypothetical protein
LVAGSVDEREEKGSCVDTSSIYIARALLTSEKDRDAMTFPHTVFIAILPLLFYYFLRSRIQLD